MILQCQSLEVFFIHIIHKCVLFFLRKVQVMDAQVPQTEMFSFVVSSGYCASQNEEAMRSLVQRLQPPHNYLLM
jgi:hypothetical protein